ncbi:MAG: VTT domain-containing protein [Cyanobacteria bacterium P01_F01_bin.53]
MAKKNGVVGRIIGFVVLIAVVAVPLIVLKRSGISNEEIQAYVEQLGIWVPFGLFLLRFTSVVIPALPGTVYAILAGTLLGFWKAFAVVCFSDFVSCSLSFWLASQYGRPLVSKLVGQRFMGRVEGFGQRHLEDNFFLLTAFLMSGFFDFVSYGVGLARTPWRKFLPPLVVSILVSTPPVVGLGAGILADKKILGFALGGLFLFSLFLGWLRRNQGVSDRT